MNNLRQMNDANINSEGLLVTDANECLMMSLSKTYDSTDDNPGNSWLCSPLFDDYPSADDRLDWDVDYSLGMRIGPTLLLIPLGRIRVAERKGMVVTALKFDMPCIYFDMFTETKSAQRNTKPQKLVKSPIKLHGDTESFLAPVKKPTQLMDTDPQAALDIDTFALDQIEEYGRYIGLKNVSAKLEVLAKDNWKKQRDTCIAIAGDIEVAKTSHDYTLTMCMQCMFSIGVEAGIIMTGGDPNSVADIKCNSIASVIEKYSIKEHIREYQGATAMKKIIDSELRGADSHRVYPSDTFRNKLRGSAVVEQLTRRTTMSENTPEKHTKRRRVEGAVTPSPAGEHLDSTGRGSTGTTRSGAGSVRSNNTTPRLELWELQHVELVQYAVCDNDYSSYMHTAE